MLPFWTSLLIRVYAWIAILQPSGLINRLLLAAGADRRAAAVALQRFLGRARPRLLLSAVHDPAALRQPVAARREPASRPPPISARGRGGCFVGVILPLSLPGIAAGALLVFIPAVGEFVIPDLLGGPTTLMIGKVLWQEFFDNVDWPAGLRRRDGAGRRADRCRCWSRSALSSGGRQREPARRLFASPRWRSASAFSTCRSRCWSPIRSTPRGWSRSGAGFRRAGTARWSPTTSSARAALTSLEIGVMAASLALVLGTCAGFAIAPLHAVSRCGRCSASC